VCPGKVCVSAHLLAPPQGSVPSCPTVLPFDAFFKKFEMRRVKPLTGDLSEMVLGEEEDRGEEIVVILVNTGGERLRS
jgi:hypothetical protein